MCVACKIPVHVHVHACKYHVNVMHVHVDVHFVWWWGGHYPQLFSKCCVSIRTVPRALACPTQSRPHFPCGEALVGAPRGSEGRGQHNYGR